MNIKTTFKLLILCLLAIIPSVSCSDSPTIVGGYSDVEVNKEISEAALFAVQTQATQEKRLLELVEIKKARQQVVAGLNYQFELIIKSAEHLYSAQVIVYRSLDGVYHLTSWRWLSSEAPK